MIDAYITGLGSFLPGDPVGNDEIEEYIGDDPKSQTIKKRILRSNGIEKRYYATERGGKPSFLCEEMAARACKEAMLDAEIPIRSVDCIAAGTSMPDMPIPSMCQMLHGRLGAEGMGPVRTIPTTGVCLAGITALDAAVLQIKVGQAKCALVAGAERASVGLKGSRYFDEYELQAALRAENPGYSYLHGAFLRWMLSDGAGAVVVEPTPRKKCLKIEWIESRSYAHELQTCMWFGASKNVDIRATDTWLAQDSMAEAQRKGMTVLRQDTQLLSEHIVSKAVQELRRLISEGRLDPYAVDLFLPHISSFFFKDELLNQFKEFDIPLTEDKWFTNLKRKGNTGAASFFIMLDEAMKTGRIKTGDYVLAMIPESSRFAYGYVLLSCVEE